MSFVESNLYFIFNFLCCDWLTDCSWLLGFVESGSALLLLNLTGFASIDLQIAGSVVICYP